MFEKVEIGNKNSKPVPTISSDGDRIVAIPFNGFDIPKTALETQVFEEGFSTGLDILEVWDQSLTGGGAVTVADSQGLFETFADNDLAQITTKLPHTFLHGFSNIWRIRLRTGNVGNEAGNVREWGIFDNNNGYFFRLDVNGMQVVIRRKTIEIVIVETAFINPISFSGTGHSYAIQYLDGNRVLFYIDNILVHTAASLIANLVATSQLKTRIRNIQSGATLGQRIIEIYGLAVIREGAPFQFDTAGRLKVSGGVAEAPAGTLEVNEPPVPKFTINPNGEVDSFRTITNGKTLVLQVLEVSAESAGTGKSIVVEIFDAPNGDDTGLIAIPGGILMGNNFNRERVIDKSFSGDGTRAILIRVSQEGSSSMLLSASYRGFEQ